MIDHINNSTDGVALLTNISWRQFQQIDSALVDRPGIRMAYLDGDLEIMSPISPKHELDNHTLNLLITEYLMENQIEAWPVGSASMREADKKSGREPDNSYCIGKIKKIPDLVVEVVYSSGGVDKLEIYRRFKVKEVWLWQHGKLHVYQLNKGKYSAGGTSKLLPQFPVEHLATWMSWRSPFKALRAYRAYLKRK